MHPHYFGKPENSLLRRARVNKYPPDDVSIDGLNGADVCSAKLLLTSLLDLESVR